MNEWQKLIAGTLVLAVILFGMYYLVATRGDARLLAAPGIAQGDRQ